MAHEPRLPLWMQLASHSLPSPGLWYSRTDKQRLYGVYIQHTYAKRTLCMYVYIQCPHVYNIQETPGDFCAHTSHGGGQGPVGEAGSSGEQYSLEEEEERSELWTFEEIGGVS